MSLKSICELGADPQARASRRPGPRRGPLAGIRVADFCWMGVGACATRVLADFGAEVIRIEDRNHLDNPRRMPVYKGQPARAFGEEDQNPNPNKGGIFNNYNRNKLGVTINMRDPRGRALAERLISSSSVVTQNFAKGIMERWGLTYGRLNTLSPEVIYARMTGYGYTGPHADYRSYGPVVQAVCGLSHVSGMPGREPSGIGFSYMDNEAAFFNAAALLAAIYRRNITGRGTEIDVSAIEVGINLLGPLFLDVSANGRTTRGPDFPLGNRLEHPNAAPHGVYPCSGEDRWIAITVFDDKDWQALLGVMRHPAWGTEARFGSQEARFQHQDALDGLLAAWTRGKDRYELMHQLQAAGVCAGAVQNAEDTNETDPQLAHRGIFFELDHPVIGLARFEGTPIQFSNTGPDNWRSAPLLGEDNDFVFKELLGISDSEYASLLADGIV
jgi:crotonobetainyl-CoA:carnitine CoA-transferase CaiB-like acyl-CoA transferase